MYRNIVGPYKADTVTSNEVPDFSLKGCKVGLLLNGVGMPSVDPQVAEHILTTVQLLTDAGAQVIDLSAQDIWWRSMTTWIEYLGLTGLPWAHSYSGNDLSKIPDSVYQWIKNSAPATVLASANLITEVQQLRSQVHDLSQDYDFILSPTISHTPFAANLYGLDNSPERHIEHLWYTGVYNLSGQPAISIPAGFDNHGLPVGIQLAAPIYEDERLLAWAQIVESLLAFDNSKPLA